MVSIGNRYQQHSAIYAAVGWVVAIVSFVFFIIWAYLPEAWLQQAGITYYPSKYYAIALPTYIIVVYLFSGMFYVSFNLIWSSSPSSMCTIKDNHSKQTAPARLVPFSSRGNGVPDVGDIDPSEIALLMTQNG